jgi:hypothetical protein
MIFIFNYFWRSKFIFFEFIFIKFDLERYCNMKMMFNGLDPLFELLNSRYGLDPLFELLNSRYARETQKLLCFAKHHSISLSIYIYIERERERSNSVSRSKKYFASA